MSTEPKRLSNLACPRATRLATTPKSCYRLAGRLVNRLLDDLFPMQTAISMTPLFVKAFLAEAIPTCKHVKQ